MENPYPCALGALLRRCFWGRPLRRPVFRAGSSSDGCRNFPRGAILSKSYCHARKLFGLGNIKELHGHASPAHAPTDPVGCNQCCRRMKYACLFCIVYSVPTQRSGEVLAPPSQCPTRCYYGNPLRARRVLRYSPGDRGVRQVPGGFAPQRPGEALPWVPMMCDWLFST